MLVQIDFFSLQTSQEIYIPSSIEQEESKSRRSQVWSVRASLIAGGSHTHTYQNHINLGGDRMKFNTVGEMPTVHLIYSDLELKSIPPLDHVQEFGLLGLHMASISCPTCGLEFEGEVPRKYQCEQCGTHNKHFKRVQTAG